MHTHTQTFFIRYLSSACSKTDFSTNIFFLRWLLKIFVRLQYTNLIKSNRYNNNRMTRVRKKSLIFPEEININPVVMNNQGAVQIIIINVSLNLINGQYRYKRSKKKWKNFLYAEKIEKKNKKFNWMEENQIGNSYGWGKKLCKL